MPIFARPLRRAFEALALVSIVWLGSTSANAEVWPSRPIHLVVPFGPGGSADVIARIMAEQLAPRFGQPVIVENRPGAGAMIGTDAVAKSAPDGYTFLMISNAQTANETLLPARPYDLMRDLTAVAALNVAYSVLVTTKALHTKTVAELVAKARSTSEKLNYASSGPGTPYHIMAEVFRSTAGIELQHVPYRSADQARTAVLAGHVAMMFDAIPTMRANIQADAVQGIATTGPERDPLLPELPTIAETLPGYEAVLWVGVMAPRGVPNEILQHFNTEVNAILRSPAMKDVQAGMGARTTPMSVAAFEEFVRKDILKQRDAILRAHIVVQ